jgi:hypothetical protein
VHVVRRLESTGRANGLGAAKRGEQELVSQVWTGELMTFASDDADRVMFADAELMVEGLRNVKTRPRWRAMRFVRDETYLCVNEGVRDKDEILRRVMGKTEEEFGSIILLAVLAALVQFIVLRILKRIFPEEE